MMFEPLGGLPLGGLPDGFVIIPRAGRLSLAEIEIYQAFMQEVQTHSLVTKIETHRAHMEELRHYGVSMEERVLHDTQNTEER